MEQLASNINITNWEIILLLFLISGGFLLGLMFGRDRIFSLLIGSYVSFAILSVFPVSKIAPNIFEKEENFVIMIVVFLVLIWLVYFLLSRSILKSSLRKKGNRSIFQIFFLSIFLIGIITSIIFSFFPDNLLSEFSEFTLKIFNNSIVRVIWLVVPIIFIGIFKGSKGKSLK